MSIQRYQITRPGPKHFRMEKADAKGAPTGEPYVGALTMRNGIGQDIPTGQYALQGYRTPAGDGFKDVILATPAEIAKLAHMRPVLLVSGAHTSSAAEEPHTGNSAPQSASDEDVIDVPDDWHTLSAAERKGLASKIAGTEIVKVKEADAVIQEYIDGRQADA